MKKRGQIDERVNPLTVLSKLKSDYNILKYGTNLPKEIEIIKQAKLDTELKKAQVKLAKQGKLPAAADDTAKAATGAIDDVKPKSAFSKAADAIKYPFQNKLKTAAGATAATTGYEYLKDPDAPIGTLVGRGVKDVVDVGTWAGEKALKFGGDVVRGYTGADTQVADKDKQTKDTKEPQAARPSDIEIQPMPTRGIGFDQLRENPAYQKVLSKYDSFLKEDINDAFMDAIKGAESGGRNIKNLAGSTAYGHYQFIEKTAKDMAKDPRNRNTPIYGKSWEEFKQDPKLQREFMKVATQDYKNTLAANKIPVTGGTMYMAHHFGPSKAVKMYQAGPNAKMSDFYPEYIKNRRGENVPNPVYTKNPALKPNQTVQYTHDRLDNLMAKKDKTNTLATIDKKQLWSGGTTVAQNVPSTTSIKPTVPSTTSIKPAVPTGTDQPAVGAAEPTAVPTQVAAADSYKDVPIGGLPKFDWEAFRQAARSGEDVSKNTERFNIPATKPVALSEKYKQFKLQEQQVQTKGEVNWDRASKDYYDMREKKLGKTASQLASASQGQFATRADRLDQAKVDAALGPGFKAGSREANLALLQKFRGQQPQPVQPAQPDQSGQGGKPGPTPSPAVPAARGAENLTPYTTAADVTGTAGLAAAAGQFLPKVGGVVAKAVPGLNVAYQGADALRRASIGDTTGSAISAAGAVPVLGIPAIAAQAVRDKFRTGSFFPSDEELKTAVDRDRGVAPTPAATPAPQAATPQVKEGIKMNKKQLKKRLEKLEETKSQVLQGMHDRAIAEGKFDAAARFAKMLRGLGGGAEALPASTIRKGGQTFDKVRGVDSELKYVNRASPTDIKSLDDIKNIGTKPPAVWRKGGDAGATTTATKAAGAADDVAAAAAKGGKPLGRGTTAALAALGGGAVGLGLGMMGKDDKPQPDPTPTPPVPPGPGPAPRPTPPKPTPDKPEKDDPFDLRPVKPSVDDTPGSEDWLRRRVNQPTTTTDTTKPTDDANDLADKYGADSYVAQAMKEDLDDIKWLAGLSKK